MSRLPRRRVKRWTRKPHTFGAPPAMHALLKCGHEVLVGGDRPPVGPARVACRDCARDAGMDVADTREECPDCGLLVTTYTNKLGATRLHRHQLGGSQCRGPIVWAARHPDPEQPPAEPTPDRLPAWARALLNGARIRASVRGMSCDLTDRTMANLVARADGRCMVTGIPFDHAPAGKGRRRPFAPSVDRINPRGGYTRRNVRLVCVIFNIALQDFRMADFTRMARALVQQLDRAPESALFQNSGAADHPNDHLEPLRGGS